MVLFAGENKAELVRAFEIRTRAALESFVAPCSTPKVFTIPLDEETSRAEFEEFSSDEAVLPEEYYLYVLLKLLFTEVFQQAPEDEADVLFLPMYVPIYSTTGIDLGAVLSRSGVLASNKPKLCVFTWESYPRPPYTRANPFDLLGLGFTDYDNDFYNLSHTWLDDSWYLAVLESTIDCHPNDFGLSLLPTPHPSPLSVSPNTGPDPLLWENDRELLYSLCGRLSYGLVPDNHIRGASNLPIWEALASSQNDDTFIGSRQAAEERWETDAAYRQVTRRSTFTLCPAGLARWTFRVFEAIHDGSVPVILSDYYQLPFERHVPWNDFSLRLPEACLPKIDSILRAIPPRRVQALRRNLQAWRHHFQIAGLAANVCRELNSRLLSP